MTRVLPPNLSRVPRRSLYLQGNPDLTCVPLTQARIASILDYNGPTVTCTNCEAGKYQSTAGVESLCVRGGEGGGWERKMLLTPFSVFSETKTLTSKP
jgi:hypothetical protein